MSSCLNSDVDELDRLIVNQYLQLPSHGDIFIAGDMAKALTDDSHYALMSCQHAMPQGKLAGHNVVNAMFGIEMLPYSQPNYATCLDLGPQHALLTSGWERELQDTGSSAKELKNQIVSQWIYPAEDISETLKMSAPDMETS